MPTSPGLAANNGPAQRIAASAFTSHLDGPIHNSRLDAVPVDLYSRKLLGFVVWDLEAYAPRVSLRRVVPAFVTPGRFHHSQQRRIEAERGEGQFGRQAKPVSVNSTPSSFASERSEHA